MSARKDKIGCADFHQALKLSRRGFVHAGALALCGLTLPRLLRAQALAPDKAKRLNSVIILWMRGGPAQQETWDPKPDAPADYRGEFGHIRTAVPGIIVNEFLPRSARMMNDWSIVRSLNHTDAGHSAGDQICFTGYPPDSRAVDVNVYPSCGSIVARQLQQQDPAMPAYVVIPRQVPGTDSAYLGAKWKPFQTQADPANREPFSIPNFAVPDGVSFGRLDDRKALLKGIDRLRRDVESSGQLDAVDRFQQQAWDLVTSTRARDAFNLDAEPAAVRERYGYLPAFKAPTPDRCDCPAWSQRILLARRLVEAGVRLVTVDCRWWDTHVKGFESLKYGFLERWDIAYTALLEDLKQRGLLDTTMVVAWGEFGRTPKVNANAGRDHWPGVFSAALAGGGIKGGRVVGSSDAKGGEPKDNPKKPQDVLATIYRHLGVDTTVNYQDLAGRPNPVLPFGAPLTELF